MLACLDSRATRLYVNQVARHLGVALIDAGVLADNMLARVSTFFPSADQACLECTWDQRDYDAVEQTYPCQPGRVPGGDTPSTGASAELGALAAALQAIECRRLLDGISTEPAGSREVIVDVRSNRMLVSRFARNTRCRLAQHAPWRIVRLRQLPEELSLDEAFALGANVGGDAKTSVLELDGLPFVSGLTCLGCGRSTTLLRLRRALTDRDRICKSCDGRLEASATQIHPALGERDERQGAGTSFLRALGLETDDIFTVRRRDERRHYELAGDAQRTGGPGEGGPTRGRPQVRP